MATVRTSNGVPLEAATVECRALNLEGPRQGGVTGKTDAAGSVFFSELEPGTYRLRLIDAGEFGVTAPLRGDGSTHDVVEQRVQLGTDQGGRAELTVRSAGSLAVQVTTDGLPAEADLRVDLWRRYPGGEWGQPRIAPRTERPASDARTGSAVRTWRFTGLEPATYRAVLISDRRVPAIAEVQVRAREQSVVRLQPGEPGLRGAFRWAGGRTPGSAGQRASLNALGSHDARPFLIDESGALTHLEGLLPEPYLLVLWDTMLARQIDLRGAPPAGPFVLQPPPLVTGPCALEVEVTRGGAGAPGLAVLLTGPALDGPKSDWSLLARTSTSARFKDLPAGLYQVTILDGGLGTTYGLGSTPKAREVRVAGTLTRVTIALD